MAFLTTRKNDGFGQLNMNDEDDSFVHCLLECHVGKLLVKVLDAQSPDGLEGMTEKTQMANDKTNLTSVQNGRKRYGGWEQRLRKTVYEVCLVKQEYGVT